MVCQTWLCLEVEGKYCKISIGCSVLFTEVFFMADIIDLALISQEGVTFDGVYGMVNNVYIIFKMNLFLFLGS